MDSTYLCKADIHIPGGYLSQCPPPIGGFQVLCACDWVGVMSKVVTIDGNDVWNPDHDGMLDSVGIFLTSCSTSDSRLSEWGNSARISTFGRRDELDPYWTNWILWSLLARRTTAYDKLDSIFVLTSKCTSLYSSPALCLNMYLPVDDASVGTRIISCTVLISSISSFRQNQIRITLPSNFQYTPANVITSV